MVPGKLCLEIFNFIVDECDCIVFVHLKSAFSSIQNEDGTKDQYRIWNPFCSKLAAAIRIGVYDISIVSFDSMISYILFCLFSIHDFESTKPDQVVQHQKISHQPCQ